MSVLIFVGDHLVVGVDDGQVLRILEGLTSIAEGIEDAA